MADKIDNDGMSKAQGELYCKILQNVTTMCHHHNKGRQEDAKDYCVEAQATYAEFVQLYGDTSVAREIKTTIETAAKNSCIDLEGLLK